MYVVLTITAVELDWWKTGPYVALLFVSVTERQLQGGLVDER